MALILFIIFIFLVPKPNCTSHTTSDEERLSKNEKECKMYLI
jgi:hypothetical protein